MQTLFRVRLACASILLAAAPAQLAFAQAPLQQRVEAALAETGPGTRFGLVVAAEDGREIVSLNPQGRFIPASNTKMFTTAAAYHQRTAGGPQGPGGTAVRLDGGGVSDVVLEGRGNPRLSSAADCTAACLAALADAVAARTRRVRHVIGDDSLFPDQRWSAGMSWNNIPSRSGTGVSALSLDDNEMHLLVRPGSPGAAPPVEHLGYYRIDNRARTVAGGATSLSFTRMPGSDLVRLSGTIAAGAEPERLRLGIDDPAHYAAWRLKALLQARGVRVDGEVLAQHRPVQAFDDPKTRAGAPPPRAPRPEPLAEVGPPPLADDAGLINKVSQNLHAELMLRRVGLVQGTGSVADGIAAVRVMLGEAGVLPDQWDLQDGSGMSTYNRLSPRGVVTFLRWVGQQPWGAEWRASLPVAGVDGTLARRFSGTPLQGKLFAKTGSLHATTALSGFLIAKSGRTLTFSAFANDMPEGVAGSKAIDAVLELIASEN
jgi:D-alanyl-D-alanine carboxypeptidase/D-alanyl-D-alanine-endopeptidase (penicillin-binding protein 4)